MNRFGGVYMDKLVIGSYVYDENVFNDTGLYEVTKITKIVGAYIYGYWSTYVSKLPETEKQFNALEFRTTEVQCKIKNIRLLKLDIVVLVGDFVYGENSCCSTGLYDVTKVTKLGGLDSDLVYGYWAIGVKYIPKTMEEFNSLRFRQIPEQTSVKNVKVFKLSFEGTTLKEEVESIRLTDSQCNNGLKAKLKIEIKNLDNYDSNILLGLANLSEEEAIDYFLSKIIPNAISIIEAC